MADLLPASFAAFGAVIGFILGATIGRILWWLAFSLDVSDVIPIVVGGLGGALALAWLGIRLSGRFTNRFAKPS